MSRLPFGSLAILEPARLFSDPQNLTLDRRMLGELRTWLANAVSKGAEACYPRIQSFPDDMAKEVLEILIGELQVLAPAQFFHLGLPVLGYHQRSLDRQVLPGGPYLLGRSCHDFSSIAEAERDCLDYAFLSPIFSTGTHPEAAPLGLEYLSQACREFQLPIIALGGISRSRAQECLQAGAAAWAGIEAFR